MGGIAGAAIAAAYGWTVWHAPALLVPDLGDVAPAAPMSRAERATASHNARLLVISAAGALVVVIGLVYTARNYRLANRGQVTDRFIKALERLGSTEMYVRVGGVHALAHVLRDSADHHTDVLQVLVAFVRDRTLWTATGETPSGIRSKPPAEPDPDVQEALSAIATRSVRPDHEPAGILHLAGLHLTGVQLPGARLRGADLTGAKLQDARMPEADLSEAMLSEANLSDAQLPGAKLRGAHLWKADLQRTRLPEANLDQAELQEACLRGALLQQASLREARLQNADMSVAHLENADLFAAQLQDAALRGAHLQEANLRGADLQDAQLMGAQLQKADLSGAGLRNTRLQGARLDDATLQGADFWHARLATAEGRTPATGLTIAQLATANVDDYTQLPKGMREKLEIWREQNR
jgi:uncharacterized protein YjbI with pentapeptide repeats